MPYDRPSWDLTSVLIVAEPEKEYFRLSPTGKISIDENGSKSLIKKGFLLTDLARKAKKTHKYITTK